MKAVGQFAMVALVTAAATWVVGWWTVPLVGAVAGFFLSRPALVGLACALAWAALLGMHSVAGAVGRLSVTLAGIMGVPAIALFVITILFPFALGWSSASLGRALRPTSHQPS